MSRAGPDRPIGVTPGRGRRLGIDVGTVRIGVALSDPDGVLATPLVTVPRDVEGGSDVRTLLDLVSEHEVVQVVVGLPRTLAGREGVAAQAAREFASALAVVLDAHDVPIVMADERLSTVIATRQLRASGRSGRRQRAVVDQVAAVAILQSWLDAQP